MEDDNSEDNDDYAVDDNIDHSSLSMITPRVNLSHLPAPVASVTQQQQRSSSSGANVSFSSPSFAQVYQEAIAPTTNEADHTLLYSDNNDAALDDKSNIAPVTYFPSTHSN